MTGEASDAYMDDDSGSGPAEEPGWMTADERAAALASMSHREI